MYSLQFSASHSIRKHDCFVHERIDVETMQIKIKNMQKKPRVLLSVFADAALCALYIGNQCVKQGSIQHS
mgnify:CR=1 FL=1